jgi:hypothetical protein
MWRTASSAVGSELKGSTVGPPNQKSDDKLCFEAYLEEAVAQSNFGERSRVRAFMIAVYTEDETIEIFEKKENNSGMTQGKFLKRYRVPKPAIGNHEPEFYSTSDFVIGATIRINGHAFKIDGCSNTFTKAWYQLNVGSNDASEFNGYLQQSNNNLQKSRPSDSYSEQRKKLDRKVDPQGNPIMRFGKATSEMAAYAEASRGNTMYGINQAAPQPGFNQPNRSQQQQTTRPW